MQLEKLLFLAKTRLKLSTAESGVNDCAANVQLAVPPTLAAGDWSVDSDGDGEGSSGDLHEGVSESDNNNY